MTIEPKKGISKKTIALIAIIIIAFSSVAVAANYMLTPKSTAKPDMPTISLTVIGSSGEQQVLNEQDIAALESYTAHGGVKTSGGQLSHVGTYTGVPILPLLDLVGGIQSDQTLTVTSSDGYSMTYTYNQVNGHTLAMYDSTGSEATPTQQIKMVAAYFRDNTVLPSDEGPLRIVFLGKDGLLGQGNMCAKMVSQLKVSASIQDWTVNVNATTNLVMNRQSFDAEISHYGINYTDNSGNVWTGTALWRWVSWSILNGGVNHTSLDAGYSVKVISGNSQYATFDKSKVEANNNIIVAAKLNGAVLQAPNWPLTLVGSAVDSADSIKNIVEIQIIPENAPIVEQDWSITVEGSTVETMHKSDFEARAASSIQTYNDSVSIWSGLPLHYIVDWAQSNSIITSDSLANGYVIKVIASDNTVLFNDTRLDQNNHIILANKVNSTILAGNYFPLTLTGADLAGSEIAKSITKIQIIPIPHIQLTLVAANGTKVNLFSNDLLKFTAYSANGGTRSNSGTLANYGSWTGVPILTLCNIVGGVTSSNSVKISDIGGGSTTYSYAAVNAQGTATYDSTGASVTPTQPLTMIVAYYLNSTAISSSNGPLRTITVGPDGYYTPGNLSWKQIVKIEII
jgi:hypothetical protein